MAKNIKKYQTTSIDEAVYLASRGLTYRSRRIRARSSVWTFEQTKKLETFRRQFWGGTAVVNLHKWMALRNVLKWQQKETESDREMKISNAMDNDFGIRAGMTYYWINDQNNIVPVMYGRPNASVHKSRFEEGRAFRTFTEASKVRASMPQVPMHKP